MRMKPIIDRIPKYVLSKWICNLTGMDEGSYRYHVRVGHIPPPRHPLYEGCEDKELFYTEEEVRDIIRFFCEREMWERFEN